MANGTPVIAYRKGSVPEVIEDGVTGFIVEDIEAAAKAVQRIRLLDRSKISRWFEQHFSADRMARDYLAVYAALAKLADIPNVVHLSGTPDQEVLSATPGLESKK